ncbi:MAG: hypothetical protein BKP49_10185 [Treponema sp. CETP13]|nr:MAG: hypothetical protein BKP49_10185 [Treponema sp. CETP13]
MFRKEKKLVVLAGTLVIALALTACSTVAPVCATSNPVGSKVGEASTKTILNILIPFKQDSGIQAAAANGGISKISTVDTRIDWNVISTTITTVVTGE